MARRRTPGGQSEDDATTSLCSLTSMFRLVACVACFFMLVNLAVLSTMENYLERQTTGRAFELTPEPPTNDSHATDSSFFYQVMRLEDAQASFPTQTKDHELSAVTSQYGKGPVILGLDQCRKFRQSVPALRRMVGAAGMFSTGTNLVTQLMKRNCYIPERLQQYGDKATKEQLGMRWQVPWGKHTPASYKSRHTTAKAAAIPKDDIMPIVTIRHPYRWMQSMCKNPYAARWKHFGVCPQLRMSHDSWNPVSVKYGAGVENYTSLVHLWVDWYEEYLDFEDPRLIIRMEDLIFYREAVIKQVCECVGGTMYANFTNVVDSAKADSPGHDTSMGWIQAWKKYSSPLQPNAGFIYQDVQTAHEVLSEGKMTAVMQAFGYQHPTIEINAVH